MAVNGLGEFNGLDYLAAARTQDGGTVIAYLPTRRVVTLEMGKISGKQATVWWYNPKIWKVSFIWKVSYQWKATILAGG